MLHCFEIELCYVYACIAFVNLLILYCNKVFEISLKSQITGNRFLYRVGRYRQVSYIVYERMNKNILQCDVSVSLVIWLFVHWLTHANNNEINL